MSRDFDPDPTYSTLENPTAAYPRDQLGRFDSEESEPSRLSTPVPQPQGKAVVPPVHEDGISWLYIGMALLGGTLLAVGVSGIVGLLVFAGS